MRPTISGRISRVPAIFTVWLLAVSLAFPPAGSAETLRVQIQPLGSLPRAGGPLPLQVTLERSAPGVLNGRLELEIPPPANLVLKTRELSLGPGAQKIEVTLPPRSWDVRVGEIVARARFTTADETIDLGDHLLFPPLPFDRVHKILAASEGSLGPRDAEIVRALQLEATYRKRKEIQIPCPIATAVAVLRADAFPGHPLDLCSYDVVYLAGQSFNLLSAVQLDAIRAWVQAGGSICLQLRSAPPSAQLGFLRELTSDSFADQLIGDLSPESRDETLRNRYRRYRSGLGCVVALAAGVPGEGEITHDGWLDTVGFLWKIRAHWRSDLENRGWWTTSAGLGDGWSFGGSRPRGDVCPRVVIQTQSIIDELLADDIQMVPPGLIVVLLVLFVLATGPLEYAVLGYFNRRKLTWYVFPVTCAIFAGLTLTASDLFLSTSEEVRSLTIVDLGEEGRVLRWNRIDLHYHQSEETVVDEGSGSLTSPCGDLNVGRGAMYALPDPNAERFRIEYEGRVPESYSYRYRVQKWSPRLLRSLSLEAPKLELPLDWDALRETLFDETRSHVSPAQVCAQLAAQQDGKGGHGDGGDLAVHLYSGGRDLCLKHDGTESASDVLDSLVFGNRGPLATLARLSPAAGPSLMDLPVLDPSDPDQILVVVVQERDSEILILRRLFHRREP